MEKKFSKTSEQWKFFMDYWEFVQRYAIPEQSDEWWDEVRKQADVLCKKYGNKQYYRDLITAQKIELERLAHGTSE